MKKNSGITMVALAVAIIVLIILAGISIQAVIGDEGVIKKSKEGRKNVITTVQSIEDKLNTLYNERRIND